MSIELMRYNAACRAVAEIRTLDEAREMINQAAGVKEYARRAQNRELEVAAGDFRFRAERKFGEMLREMKENGELGDGRPVKDKTITTTVGFPTRVILKDLGVSANFSSRCQRLAGQPDIGFERRIAEWKRRAKEGKDFDLLYDDKKDRRDRRERELSERICALPTKRFGLIVADPEWRFQVWSRETGMDRAADNHYPTSELCDIKARDVASVAADDCALGLWSTVPMLVGALEVMEEWGFEYKTHWIWVKDRIGPGYWNRNKHEVFLFGTRGHIPCPAQGQQWDSIIEAPRKGHSEKPEDFLEMLESYFPLLPKIELNRRGPPRRGWDAWGLEAEVERVHA